MKITIDRIEENFAVAETPNGAFVNIPLLLFKDMNISEGDIFTIEKDEKETEKRKNESKDLLQNLFKNSNKKSRN